MKHARRPGFLVLLAVLLGLVACHTPPPPPVVVTPPPAFRPEKLAEMDAAINQAIAEKRCPGGVLWLEHHGVGLPQGLRPARRGPAPEPMTEDTIFDAASLTKVLACTPAVMLLVERGQVRLEATVQKLPGGVQGRRQGGHHRPSTADPHVRPAAGTSDETDWHGQTAAIRRPARRS